MSEVTSAASLTQRPSCVTTSPMMVRTAEACRNTTRRQTAGSWRTEMLIPMADVPRWYAERKPDDTIAISHGADTLTWGELERGANARARAFAEKGVKPGDFVAIGLPNGTPSSRPASRCGSL